MKKVLFVMLLSAAALVAHSQVSVGIKGGLNVTNLSSDADATYNSRTGYHAGLYARVKFANIGIQPELLYSQTGTEVDLGAATADFKQDFTYLTIPVMLKFYLVQGINIHAGPQFGFLMSTDGGISYQDANGNQVTFDKDSYKDADISAAIGAGWDTPFGLNLAVRYLFGLNDVADNAIMDEAKTRTFQVSAGFRLFGD